MTYKIGRVLEIRLEPRGQTSALVECPPDVLPAAGQYVQAYAPDDPGASLPVSLFPSHISPPADGGKAQFVAAPPLPPAWQPGTPLNLRGPLGAGFQIPNAVKRLALAAVGKTSARLLPLIDASAEIALFSDYLPAQLPTHVEANPLSALPEALSWADFLAIDCPLDQLPALQDLIGIEANKPLPCPAQILVSAPMPCGALAECGVCAVNGKRGYKLACKDGPVFEWGDLRL